MDPRGNTRFNARLRLPLRHKKRRPLTQTAPCLDIEPPPSYSECSAYFYAPPSYEESVSGGSARNSGRSVERRHSVNRMSWGSDTSTSSSESSSSAHSAASATPTSSSSSSSHITPTAPSGPSPPLATSCATSSSALSLWLSSVSSTLSSPRSVENLSGLRHRCASSDSIVSTSVSSSPDVITRIQPRLRSWTQCMRWVIQYTLEGNFKSTVAHFQCLVNEGLRVCRQHESDTEAYPIRLASLRVPRPTVLSLKTWIEFILCVGFKFSQSHVNNHNNNNNSDDDGHQYNFLARILENANNNNNNNNGNTGDELGDLCVIVPRGLAPRRLMKHRDVLTGLLELPYNAIKTAANMSRTETERIIALLTPLIQSSHDTSSPSANHAPSLHHAQSGDHALSLDHALVRSVWDVHRRPGFLLQSLGFTVSRRGGGEAGGRCLTVPAGEAATRRFQLAKDILEMFLRT